MANRDGLQQRFLSPLLFVNVKINCGLSSPAAESQDRAAVVRSMPGVSNVGGKVNRGGIR